MLSKIVYKLKLIRLYISFWLLISTNLRKLVLRKMRLNLRVLEDYFPHIYSISWINLLFLVRKIRTLSHLRKGHAVSPHCFGRSCKLVLLSFGVLSLRVHDSQLARIISKQLAVLANSYPVISITFKIKVRPSHTHTHIIYINIPTANYA